MTRKCVARTYQERRMFNLPWDCARLNQNSDYGSLNGEPPTTPGARRSPTCWAMLIEKRYVEYLLSVQTPEAARVHNESHSIQVPSMPVCRACRTVINGPGQIECTRDNREHLSSEVGSGGAERACRAVHHSLWKLSWSIRSGGRGAMSIQRGLAVIVLRSTPERRGGMEGE